MRKGSSPQQPSFRRRPTIVVAILRPVTIAWFVLHCPRLDAWTNGFSLRKPTANRIILSRSIQLKDAIAGSFFNPIPEPNSNDDSVTDGDGTDDSKQSTTSSSKARQASTINGIPSEQVGLDLGMTLQAARQKDPITRKPYVGIGPSSLNDVTKPEYDDQGYTLYVDERTGTRARVFEALVTYPCLFTLKIVGAHDDTFVRDVLQIVANTCQVETAEDKDPLDHSIKYNGKWASITVQAPVRSAEMLYQLYENVDRDPRVKFKF